VSSAQPKRKWSKTRCIIAHGGIQIEQVGELETKDATRWRIKWYAGMSVMSMLG
jgi:hypothetical protein